MKKKKINIYAVVVVSLVLLEGIFIFLSYKSFNNQEIETMDEVKLLNSETLDKNSMFAIMLGDENGIYTESDSNKWPTDGSYSFNAERSGCIDANGNTLEGALTFNVSSWTATLTTNTTAYCYLYFDKDQVAPQAFTFYIGGSTNPSYTKTTSTSLYLSWTDTDITKYCVTTESSSANCSWTASSGTSATTNYTLATGDGIKTLYAYLQDAAGNISEQVTDTITLDTGLPSVTVGVASSTAGNSPWYKAISIKGTGTDVTTSVVSIKHCTTTSSTCTPTTTVSATSATVAISTSNTTAQKVCFQATDSAGNVSTVTCSSAYSVDVTPPSVTSISDAGDGKITFSASDSHSGVYQYCVNQNATSTTSCTWYTASSGSQTTGAIVTANGDYYVHVKDNAGNIGHSSKVTMQVSQPAGEYIENLGTTTSAGDLNRYQGTSANNYLCFGYSNYETDCDFTNTTNSDKYAYRIIGINSSGQLKLIKKEALNTAYAWNSSTGVSWNSASLYTNLNGSYFYTNTTYVPTAWKSKIAKTTWKYGDTTSTHSYNGATAYTTEQAWTSTVSNYIGLMYQSDYLLAYSGGNPGSYSNAKTSWIFLFQSGNDSAPPNTSYEWLMSRYNSSYPWLVNSNGGLFGSRYMTNTYSVRPVFYLTSDVQFVDGTGTSSDPFIIE